MGYDWKIPKYPFKVQLLYQWAEHPSAGTKALYEKHYGVLVYIHTNWESRDTVQTVPRLTNRTFTFTWNVVYRHTPVMNVHTRPTGL